MELPPEPVKHEIGNRTYIVADVEPLDVDGVRTVQVGLGIWFVMQKRKAMTHRHMSDFDRMDLVTKVRPSVHAMRTQLDPIDRRLMAIEDHIAKPNDELAREIEALREEK